MKDTTLTYHWRLLCHDSSQTPGHLYNCLINWWSALFLVTPISPGLARMLPQHTSCHSVLWRSAITCSSLTCRCPGVRIHCGSFPPWVWRRGYWRRPAPPWVSTGGRGRGRCTPGVTVAPGSCWRGRGHRWRRRWASGTWSCWSSPRVYSTKFHQGGLRRQRTAQDLIMALEYMAVWHSDAYCRTIEKCLLIYIFLYHLYLQCHKSHCSVADLSLGATNGVLYQKQLQAWRSVTELTIYVAIAPCRGVALTSEYVHKRHSKRLQDTCSSCLADMCV